jgi:hypothetical protein
MEELETAALAGIPGCAVDRQWHGGQTGWRFKCVRLRQGSYGATSPPSPTVVFYSARCLNKARIFAKLFLSPIQIQKFKLMQKL